MCIRDRFITVDDLRRNSHQFTYNNGFTIKGRPANRVEFFPIQWYSSVRDEKFGIDKYVINLFMVSKFVPRLNLTLTLSVVFFLIIESSFLLKYLDNLNHFHFQAYQNYGTSQMKH